MVRMRDVLLFVSGTTPQIVTETIWGIHRAKRKFAPAEVHVITTTLGQTALERALLSGGRLAALCSELSLPTPEVVFHLIGELGVRPLEDIRNSHDNTVLANTVMTVVRDLTEDASSVLHASLSGGRKTMSFYLGYAMSLYGRANDVLYHVMVPGDFERCNEFFFIPKVPVILRMEDGALLSTADASIEIAEIPILKLRSWVNEPLLHAATVDFGSVTASVQAVLSRSTLRFEDDDCRVSVGSLSFPLRAQLYAMYRTLAETCVKQMPGAGPDGVGPEHKGWLTSRDFATAQSRGATLFLSTLERLPKGRDANFLFAKTSMKQRGDSAYMAKTFNPIFAHLRSALKAGIPDPALRAQFWVVSTGRQPRRYGLALTPERIVLA
jgi:CRISPR-associated protein (TIGR02584 family)